MNREEMLKAIIESQENDKTILKALVKIMDDQEEIKAGLRMLTGKQEVEHKININTK